MLGDPGSQFSVQIEDDENLPDLALFGPTQPEEITRTVPIAFDDPEFDGGATLLGAYPPKMGTTKTIRDRMIVDGTIDPAPIGRADHFSKWDTRTLTRILPDQTETPTTPAVETVGAIR